MSSFTVTVTATAAAAPAAVVLPLRTPLGQLFDALRKSPLFVLHEVEELEKTVQGASSEEERNLALAWFYREKVLPQPAEQILELSDRFEALFEVEEWLGQLESIEEMERTAQAAKRALEAQVVLGDVALDSLRGRLAALEERLQGDMGDWIEAEQALTAGCESATAEAAALAEANVEVNGVVVQQNQEWDDLVKRGLRDHS